MPTVGPLDLLLHLSSRRSSPSSPLDFCNFSSSTTGRSLLKTAPVKSGFPFRFRIRFPFLGIHPVPPRQLVCSFYLLGFCDFFLLRIISFFLFVFSAKRPVKTGVSHRNHKRSSESEKSSHKCRDGRVATRGPHEFNAPNERT